VVATDGSVREPVGRIHVLLRHRPRSIPQERLLTNDVQALQRVAVAKGPVAPAIGHAGRAPDSEPVVEAGDVLRHDDQGADVDAIVTGAVADSVASDEGSRGLPHKDALIEGVRYL